MTQSHLWRCEPQDPEGNPLLVEFFRDKGFPHFDREIICPAGNFFRCIVELPAGIQWAVIPTKLVHPTMASGHHHWEMVTQMQGWSPLMAPMASMKCLWLKAGYPCGPKQQLLGYGGTMALSRSM